MIGWHQLMRSMRLPTYFICCMLKNYQNVQSKCCTRPRRPLRFPVPASVCTPTWSSELEALSQL